MKTSAIITAAGYGSRMGGEKKKQFIELGNLPIITRTLQKFQDSSLVNEIILVVPNNDVSYCEKEIKVCYNLSKVVKIVPGGEKRQDSVFQGLQSVSHEMDIVIVHDGIRPFISSQLIENSVKKAESNSAVVAAVPVKDTLKKVSAQNSISESINRSFIWRIQTPQTFKKEILTRAFEKARQDKFYGTDESTLVTRLGIPVYVVAGSELNIKITTPEDITLGESILLTIND